MRILLVINGTDFGGAETALAETARVLSDRGHAVSVISLKEPGPVATKIEEHGLRVLSLGMDAKPRPWSLLLVTLRLSFWLGRNPVDVVYSYLPRANIVSRIASKVAAGRRIHLSSEHSTDFNRATWVRRLNRWTDPWTDRVLAVSPTVREVLITRDGLPQDKIHILANGLDARQVDVFPETDLRSELGLCKGSVVFCGVGRLVADKGYKYVLRALARVPAESRPHFVLVGEGPEKPLISQEIVELGLDGHVHLLGFRTDVLGILKGADALLLPSLEEGIPVVLLEAMACSLPIIATAVGGVPDTVVDEETALLIPPAENWTARLGERISESLEATGVAALREAMSRLIEDAELRDRMGQAGRRRLEEMFSLDRVVDQLEAHCSELAEEC